MAVEFVAVESMVLAVESVAEESMVLAVGSVVLAGESGVVGFEAVELLADLAHLKSKSIVSVSLWFLVIFLSKNNTVTSTGHLK